jgi:hypothetical protein
MIKLKIVILILTLFSFSSCVNQKENNLKNSNTTDNSLNKNQAAHSNDFYFVGNINGRAGIYKYNLRKNSYHKFWSKTNASVVELSHSPKGDKIFFLTATSLGKAGVFPFIHNVKLYLLNCDSSKVKFIKLIGSGLQVFTAWETDNSFKVILNSFDLTVANYINQHTIIYSEFGRKLVDETKTFDITKEGYPKPPVINKKTKSPYGEFSIAVKDSPKTSIYLKNAHNKKIFIASVSQKLNQIEWAPGNKYLIFSTINITPRNNTLYNKNPETAKIFIYSIPDKKIIKEWNGGGLKNFILLKDLLIFDDGFSKKSSITIFNLKTLQITNSIRIKGGCGTRNIPSIPDYSA